MPFANAAAFDPGRSQQLRQAIQEADIRGLSQTLLDIERQQQD